MGTETQTLRRDSAVMLPTRAGRGEVDKAIMSNFDPIKNSLLKCLLQCMICKSLSTSFKVRRLILLFRWLVISLVCLIVPSVSGAELAPDSDSCQLFRKGPVVEDRIAVYSDLPGQSAETFRWLDISYRPEYLFRPLIGGNPDGLPKTGILFEMFIDDGQPLPIDGRGKIRPQESKDFMLLLTGRPFLPLERSIAIYAFAPDGSTYSRTGEDFYGYQRIEVSNRRLLGGKPQTTDIFIEEDQSGRLVGVLQCDQPGSKPVPSCQFNEITKDFQVNISGFRLDQMKLIAVIKAHARDFISCLTYGGQ